MIMTTMTMTTMTTITKTKIMMGMTLIKYQKMMKAVPNRMMILTMVTNPKITMIIIITQKMRKMMMRILLNLKMMIKIQITSINLKNLQVEIEETDIVFIDPYPVSMMVSGLIGIEWVLTYALY